MKISKFLPNVDTTPRPLLQVRLDMDLWEQVNKKRKRMKLSWVDLVTAMFKAFLEELR